MRVPQVTVRRIVANVAADSVSEVGKFYVDLFELEVVMDHGWIVTLASGEKAITQLSVASEGGSGTPVPDISIEVDDVDSVYARAKAGSYHIVYDITDEPWGVRRFYVRDPAGKLLNVLSHRH
jgi:predicted enzyme related to lactoylglutathione lyase